jgi:BASS family bile acid:Na+ symporter
MLQLLLLVGLPLGVGMLLRARYPAKAMRAETYVKRVAVLMLVVLIVGAVLKEKERVVEYFAILGIPITTLSLGTIAIGLLSALAFRLPLRQAVTIGIEVGMQNAALGIGLAMTTLGSEEIAMPAVIYGILAYFTCFVALMIGRRFIPLEEGAPPAVGVVPASSPRR